MPSPIQTLFNPSLGIQSLMPMPEETPLPDAKELAPSQLRESSLDQLYGPANARTAIESYLCPNVGDGTLVSPEVFSSELEAIVEKLRSSEHPAVRAMLEEEVLPLLVNGQLLAAYRGLMIGG